MNLDVKVEDYGHAYAIVTLNGDEYKLDATCSDLMRVKMKLATNGYHPIDMNISYLEYLQEVDDYLNYIYQDEIKIRKHLKDISTSKTSLLKNVNELLVMSNCRFHYEDAIYFFNLLCVNKGMNFETFVSNDFSIYRLYNVYQEGTYFSLDKTSGEYNLREISEEECITLSNTLKADNKNKLWLKR